VTCRIEARYERDRWVVHLAGRLTEAQVPALLETCARGTEPPLVELDDLVSADVVGIDALLRIEQQGAEFVGLAEYLRLKLEVLAREQKH
jgi:hypothetical protein